MILVDGHNLIGRSRRLSLDEEEASREELLRRIGAVKSHKGEAVVVVFDGNRPRGNRGEKAGSVAVFYTPSGHSADEEIIRRVDSAKSPHTVTVVTSDLGLAARAKARGARTCPCERFWETLTRPKNSAPKKEKPDPSAKDAAHWLEMFRESSRK
jgi:predicted RNA-binding protein with PIN domain